MTQVGRFSLGSVSAGREKSEFNQNSNRMVIYPFEEERKSLKSHWSCDGGRWREGEVEIEKARRRRNKSE
jgi:hypothetical protein